MHYEILQQRGLFDFRGVEQELRILQEKISTIHNTKSQMTHYLVDLVAIAAAELSISGYERFRFRELLPFEERRPLSIEAPDVFRAVRKTDTLLLIPCRSVERLSQPQQYRKIFLSDLFLFTADLQKAESLCENDKIDINDLNAFHNSFNQFAAQFVEAQIRSPLSGYFFFPFATFESILKVQTVIWNLRIGLLLDLPEDDNNERTGRLMGQLGINDLGQ